jgi:ATP synthase protein I
MSFRRKLLEHTQRDLQRLDQRKRRPAAWIGLLFSGGLLGLLFVVPIIGGAYLGRWLDTMASGFSACWTLSLIILGVVVGAYNVFRFLQGKS